MSGESNITEQCRQVFTEYLKSMRMRPSAERLRLLELACAIGRPFSVRQLHDAAETTKTHISPATVYNTINLLCECGIARVTPSKKMERTFEICGRPTISYVCRRCGKSKTFRDTKAEAFLISHKFRGITTECFTLSLSGLCPACAKAIKRTKQPEKKTAIKQPNKELKK